MSILNHFQQHSQGALFPVMMMIIKTGSGKVHYRDTNYTSITPEKGFDAIYEILDRSYKMCTLTNLNCNFCVYMGSDYGQC